MVELQLHKRNVEHAGEPGRQVDARIEALAHSLPLPRGPFGANAVKAAVPSGLPCGRALMLAVGVMVTCLFGFAASAWAATDTVTNTSDSGSGSLREAIAEAGGGDTIAFDASLEGQTINLTSGAIGIDKSLTIEGLGASLLTIDAGHNSQIFTVTEGDVSISGLTLANGSALENGGAINDTSGGSLSVSESTFTGNAAGGAGGSGDYSGFGRGGAIYAAVASLVVSDSTFSNNTAGGVGDEGESSGAGSGGAIRTSAPSFSISGSTFTGNAAGGPGGGGFDSGHGSGGAIDDTSGGSLTISESTFSNNTVGGPGAEGGNGGGGAGGALDLYSSLLVSGSAFSANSVGGEGGEGSGSGAGLGGAIYGTFLPLIISGSTFSANSVGGTGGAGFASGRGNGGAIYASGLSLSASNSTLIANAAGGSGAAGSGGAITLAGPSASATLASVTIDGNTVGDGGAGAGINDIKPAGVEVAAVTAKATIISGNTGAGATDCNMPVGSSTYSLEGPSTGDTSCGFDLPSADPQLEPLADNGGPTETQALPASSPAVDAVPETKCPTSTDQRGQPRPDNGEAFCDVGAFELQDPTVAPAITSAAAATFQIGKSGSFTVTATGLPAPVLSLTGALPSGVGFTDKGDGTATLSGTPAAGSGGNYPVTIKASNGTSPDATQSFTLKVQGPPKVSIVTPARGATYTRGPAIYSSFTCTEGAGGPGIASCVDHNGRPSGAPLNTAKTGRHTFTVTATSKDGLTRRARVAYKVVAPKTPKAPRRRQPRVLVSYRQEGGIGGPQPSLLVFKNRHARVMLGSCTAKFALGRRIWHRLRAALRGAHLHVIAGNYPPPKGSADEITYVIRSGANMVRIALPQPRHRYVVRRLRPLLRVLNKVVSAGKRRMASSCKRSRSRAHRRHRSPR